MSAVQRIVRTLEVAAVVGALTGTIQRIQVQTTDEPHLPGRQPPPVDVAHMSLRDGAAALLAPQLRPQGVHQVYIAIVAHRQVLHVQFVSVHIQHREVAHGSLHLPALRGQHHVAGLSTKSYERQFLATDDHTEGFAAIFAFHHLGHVGIVHPVHPRTDIKRRRVLKVGHGLAEVVKDVGRGLRLSSSQRTVEQQMPGIQLQVRLGTTSKPGCHHPYQKEHLAKTSVLFCFFLHRRTEYVTGCEEFTSPPR